MFNLLNILKDEKTPSEMSDSELYEKMVKDDHYVFLVSLIPVNCRYHENQSIFHKVEEESRFEKLEREKHSNPAAAFMCAILSPEVREQINKDTHREYNEKITSMKIVRSLFKLNEKAIGDPWQAMIELLYKEGFRASYYRQYLEFLPLNMDVMKKSMAEMKRSKFNRKNFLERVNRRVGRMIENNGFPCPRIEN